MGQGQSLEDPPPGPLPHSSLLCALGNIAVPAQFKVQTLELYKFAGLAAVGLRDPRILVLPLGGCLAAVSGRRRDTGQSLIGSRCCPAPWI